jgi:hypothetical protein
MTTSLAITQQLEACEAVIERGMTTFIEVGNALLRIRDERLYRQEYRDFETYCQARWAMNRRYANRLIEAADVADRLGPIGPRNEGQARELSGLPAETAAQVMQEAHDLTAGQPTATVIREVRERIGNPDLPLTQEECEALDDAAYCDGSCGDGLCECLAEDCSCGFLPPDARATDASDTPTPAKGSGVKDKKSPGPRVGHLKILTNAAASLSGMQILLDAIEELDATVTADEARQLWTDLDSATRSLNRIKNLTKERSNT